MIFLGTRTELVMLWKSTTLKRWFFEISILQKSHFRSSSHFTYVAISKTQFRKGVIWTIWRTSQKIQKSQFINKNNKCKSKESYERLSGKKNQKVFFTGHPVFYFVFGFPANHQLNNFCLLSALIHRVVNYELIKIFIYSLSFKLFFCCALMFF